MISEVLGERSAASPSPLPTSTIKNQQSALSNPHPNSTASSSHASPQGAPAPVPRLRWSRRCLQPQGASALVAAITKWRFHATPAGRRRSLKRHSALPSNTGKLQTENFPMPGSSRFAPTRRAVRIPAAPKPSRPAPGRRRLGDHLPPGTASRTGREMMFVGNATRKSTNLTPNTNMAKMPKK
jgi:hypothetical protein